MQSTDIRNWVRILFHSKIRDRLRIILAHRLLASPGSSRQAGSGSRQERSYSIPPGFRLLVGTILTPLIKGADG